MRTWRWLLVPLGLYLGLISLYLVAIPLGESPDEPGHLQCVEQVATLNRLPIVEPLPTGDWWRPGVTRSGRMCYHMPAYYVVAGLVQKSVGFLYNTPLSTDFPVYNEAFGQTGIMFQHPNSQVFLPGEEPLPITAVRLLSVLLGGVMVWAAFAVALHLFPGSIPAAVGAGVLVAGWPQFLFLSRAISNDVLANALAVATLVILLQFGRPQRYPWAALSASMAVLTKISMFFVVVSVSTTWLLEYVGADSKRPSLRRNLWVAVAVWLATAIFVLAVPTIRDNFWSSNRAFGAINQNAGSLQYWTEVAYLTASSGWVRFGWMNVTAPDILTYLWWGVMSLLTISGIARWGRTDRPDRRLTTTTLLVWVLGLGFSYLRINLAVMQPQFRFLQSVLPIIAAFAAGGLLMPWQSKSVQWVSVTGVALALVMMNGWIVTHVVMPFYAYFVLRIRRKRQCVPIYT